MRARIIKIGSSQGLQIVKPVLEQTGVLMKLKLRLKYSLAPNAARKGLAVKTKEPAT